MILSITFWPFKSKAPRKVGAATKDRQWIMFLFALSLLLAATNADNRPGAGKSILRRKAQHNGFQTRIIGGSDARLGRYPYMTSLLRRDNAKHACGGALIAPDLILTAAHCKSTIGEALVGRWLHDQIKSNGDDHERFEIIAEHIHPEYNDNKFSHDLMILALNGISTKQYVRLNTDDTIPRGFQDELTVVGFGHTLVGNELSVSTVLQEVDITYVTNDDCELSKDSQTKADYRGLITDDMLCASDYRQDSCQGDSGGPLIVGSDDVSTDTLVGIVSWGYGCAAPVFPGVYARISSQYNWIRSTVCRISSKPPPELDCGEGLFSDPHGPETVPITVIIRFDDFPLETGWSITEEITGSMIVEVAKGRYERKRERVEETVYVPGGQRYIFTITDSYGDGMCCTQPGEYMAVLGTNDSGEVLLAGSSNFGHQQLHQFVAPAAFESPIEDQKVVIGDDQIPISVVIKLDDYANEIGWRIDKLGLEVEEVVRVPAGIYLAAGETIIRTFALDKGQLYYFKIFDAVGDGIRGGYVKLFLGERGGGKTRDILDIGGDFGRGTDISFVASYEDSEVQVPIESDTFLTLELRFGLYPEEIGFQIHSVAPGNFDDTVIFFRHPQHFAGLAEQTVIERIPIPNPEAGEGAYRFIIADTFGDGMCCNWAGKRDTGYTLYDGAPENGVVIANSRFESSARESFTFTLALTTGSDPDYLPPTSPPATPVPLVNIHVIVSLSDLPHMVGFSIADLAGKIILDIPVGTYTEGNRVIEEMTSLRVGLYVFTIIGSAESEANWGGESFTVRYTGMPDRPPLIQSSGDPATPRVFIFQLDYTATIIPLDISFTTDSKPEEFGYSIRRIDNPHSEALVAMRPPGSFTKGNEYHTESLLIEGGGLYRIILEDSGGDGIGSRIDIVVGGRLNNIVSKVLTFERQKFEQVNLKIYAGSLQRNVAYTQSLQLHIPMDRFPQEVEWVLLSGQPDVKDAIAVSSHPGLGKGIIAYGPVDVYPQSFSLKEVVETIPLPPFSGTKSFTIILSDTQGDGVCCDFGEGGPVALYNGPSRERKRIFIDSFNGKARVAHTFQLEGNGDLGLASFSGSRFEHVFFRFATVVLCSVLLLK